MVQTALEIRQKDRAKILDLDRFRKKAERQRKMLGSDCHRKKEERQSNTAWFGQPQKEGGMTETKCLVWTAIERRKKD